MDAVITNQLIEILTEDPEPRLCRVVWTDGGGEDVALYDLKKENAFPELFLRSEIQQGLNNGIMRFLQIDPFAYLQMRKLEDDDPDLARRDRAYESIADLVENHMPELFAPRSRGILVRRAAKAHKTTRRMVRLRLRLYWQRGLCPNALLPQYRPPPEGSSVGKTGPGTGKPGVDKPAEGEKLGVKSAVSKATKQTTGIKIVSKSETARRLSRGYKLYRLEQQLSVPKAYKETINRLFNIGW